MISEVLKAKNKKADTRILAIDSSTKSLAASIFERSGEHLTLIAVFKISYDEESMSDKFVRINNFLPVIFQKYGPIDNVAIEQTIYIQSPQTSRLLSYIVGHIWGKCIEYCDNVTDVTIAKWKSYIGYKNVTKKEIQAWEKEFGKKEANKIAKSERKQRTIKIMHEKIPETSSIDDNDIMDAIAIGYWAIKNL